ncbi:variable surface lipoprotein [Metamycoplasma canadense]|uniref:Uncharacterized protein n=1 Tax=Metamycoplasma canadense TaxID=29554 RepID=A0A077L7J7_9BACT|nr:variable surface lipoprotein [Metamycoplasma canadense]BAP39801.1 hypothetical protein MCAN360_0788 [Metamycoplasma canadense]
MKKLKKILLTFGFLAPLTTLPIISAACDNKKEENSKDINEEINKIKKEYEDLQKKTNSLISSTSEKEKKKKDLQKLLDEASKKITDLEKEINNKKLEELKKLNNQYLGLADALKDGFAEYPELGEDKEDGSFNDFEENFEEISDDNEFERLEEEISDLEKKYQDYINVLKKFNDDAYIKIEQKYENLDVNKITIKKFHSELTKILIELEKIKKEKINKLNSKVEADIQRQDKEKEAKEQAKKAGEAKKREDIILADQAQKDEFNEAKKIAAKIKKENEYNKTLEETKNYLKNIEKKYTTIKENLNSKIIEAEGKIKTEESKNEENYTVAKQILEDAIKEAENQKNIQIQKEKDEKARRLQEQINKSEEELKRKQDAKEAQEQAKKDAEAKEKEELKNIQKQTQNEVENLKNNTKYKALKEEVSEFIKTLEEKSEFSHIKTELERVINTENNDLKQKIKEIEEKIHEAKIEVKLPETIQNFSVKEFRWDPGDQIYLNITGDTEIHKFLENKKIKQE